jgi:TBC1 domain family protein 5
LRRTSPATDNQKNLPDLSSPTATAYSYIPSLASSFSPLGSPALQADVNSPFSSIPSSASPLPSHRFATAQYQGQSPAQSHSSVRSLRDVERDLAELRLAMLGMGKAMSGWLLSLEAGGEEAEAAKEGMGKLKESLLNAASAETSTIVHQWGWSEALETPPSRSSTPVKVYPGPRAMSPAPQATPPTFSTFGRSAGPNSTRESPARITSPQAAPSQPVQLGDKPEQTGGVASTRNPKDEPHSRMQTPPIESATTTPVNPLSGTGVGSAVGIHRTGSGPTRPPKQATRQGFAPQPSASVDPLLGSRIRLRSKRSYEISSDT